MRRVLPVLALSLAALFALVGYVQRENTAQHAPSTPPRASYNSLQEPVPPTTTPVLPIGYKTPTPIPPEQQRFFIAMGGGIGIPAIQPCGAETDPSVPAITREDVEQYVKTHRLRGQRVTIRYESSETAIISIELVQLEDVYKRYTPEALLSDWRSPYRPNTPVYLVELRGAFRFSGGPSPGKLGTYRTGVWVFKAHNGYDILEGGVNRIDRP